MNSDPTPGPAVRHNPAAGRFEIEIDGHRSVIDYAQVERTITFAHTFVPPELRGRGVAEKLVRTALEYARAEQLHVVPECSYVAKFIGRHAEYQSLLQ